LGAGVSCAAMNAMLANNTRIKGRKRFMARKK
jgi:hypothetical protein